MKTSLTPALLALALAGCAMVPSPEIISVAAGPDALRCGADAVEGIGYVVEVREPGVVEANSIAGGLPARADRHVVELRVDDGADPHLVATVSRWRYEPSERSLPIEHQGINQARPDGDQVEAVRRAVERCRRGP